MTNEEYLMLIVVFLLGWILRGMVHLRQISNGTAAGGSWLNPFSWGDHEIGCIIGNHFDCPDTVIPA